MSNDIVIACEELLKKLEKITRFECRYHCSPHEEVGRILAEIKTLASSIPDIETPKDNTQVVQSELKRRLNGEVLLLEGRLNPCNYEFSTIVSIYGIPSYDINGLREWLLAHKEQAVEIIQRLYTTNDVQDYELGLPFDIPKIRRQAEEFADIHIGNFHRKIGRFLEDLTQIGGFLRDINAVPTSSGRSYFHPLTDTLAIDISDICFTTKDGTVQLRERDLIRIYGHEGMGHALNQIITRQSQLPYFLKRDNPLTAATCESIAQFYQLVLFEDLRHSPEMQNNLGINHKFGGIYQEARDVALLNEYQSRLYQYAITVLADKTLGNPQDHSTLKRKIDMLAEVTINPWFALNFVEQNRYNFDSEGNLSPKLVKELIYCAQPVQRALAEFERQGIKYEGNGRNAIDATFLTGFWTPLGFVDNARVRAQELRG